MNLDKPFRIATWNVNSIRARLPLVTAWLEQQQPDALLLQELKGLEFPAEAFEPLGYRSVAVTQKTYNGVATLTRHPIEATITTLPGDEEDSHARYLETVIAGTRIVNIYLPNGNPVGTDKFEYKLRWMDRLRQQMAVWLQSPMPTLIAGDFNVIPEELDCYKASAYVHDALYQPESRARYRALLSLGYTDAFRALHPDQAGHYTYWDYFRGAFEKNRGIRIDHFLLSPALAARLTACEIDKNPRTQERPSDHTPILATFGPVQGR